MSDQEEVVTAVAEPPGRTARNTPQQAPPPADGEGDEPDIGRFLGALDRGKYLIALLVVCCTLGAYVYVENQTPKYRASLDMVVGQGGPAVPEDLKDLTLFRLFEGSGRSSASDPESQVAILTSRQLAKEAVRRLALYTSPLFQPQQEQASTPKKLIGQFHTQISEVLATLATWVGTSTRGEAAARAQDGAGATNTEGDVQSARKAAPREPSEEVLRALADRYREGLTVRKGRASGLLRVSYVSKDPIFAALAANTTAGLYIERQHEAQQRVNETSSRWLRTEVAEARERLLASEKALERFRQETGLSENVSGSVPARRLADLKSSVVEVRAELEDLKSRQSTVTSMREETSDLTVAGPLLESDILRELRNERLGVQHKIENLQATYREAHPRMRAAKRDLASVNDRIRTEIANFQADLKRQIQTARERVKSLKQEIGKLETTVDELRVSEGQMRALSSEVDANRHHYQTLLQQFKNADLQERQKGSTRAAIINEATVPEAPFAPNPPMVLGASFIMSTLAGIAIVLGLELMQKGVRRLSDLDQRNGVEPMGVVPRLRLKKGQTAEGYLLADVTTPYAESIRNLRTGLSLLVRSQSLGCVLVTSALNGEGKSTVAKALAAQAADAGQRAIVVDCDFRGGRAEADSVPGMADCLRGDTSLKTAITKLPGTDADWLGAGCNCRYPDEILGSASFPKLLKQLEDRYDHVILDGTALLMETDILRRASLANIVLLLVQWGTTSSEAVDLAVQRLHEAGVQRLTGALTHVDLNLYRKYESGAYKALVQLPGPVQPAILASNNKNAGHRFRLFG